MYTQCPRDSARYLAANSACSRYGHLALANELTINSMDSSCCLSPVRMALRECQLR